jgi:hypothetical protein
MLFVVCPLILNKKFVLIVILRDDYEINFSGSLGRKKEATKSIPGAGRRSCAGLPLPFSILCERTSSIGVGRGGGSSYLLSNKLTRFFPFCSLPERK